MRKIYQAVYVVECWKVWWYHYGCRPEDGDFGVAPSEEWRTMSAVKARNRPNIRRWGYPAAGDGVRRPPLLARLIARQA
jgi:hypothetical protein